ncbi:MAG TPA: NERD domain-containing protein [Trueperaceae bacterium]|nr:NERD domain-containing protein [Trueperaceae bacterium]
MIAKELDPYVSNHDYEQAILTAQEDLAFFMKIMFAKSSTVKRLGLRVFNGLRFEMDNYAIQIDHLILHKYGIIVIENRSETADIDINLIGQWTQTYKAKSLKITSPLEQGERKLEFIRSVLEHNHKVLRAKNNNSQADFKDFAFDLIVAISDHGNINSSSGNLPLEICRRSKVVETILEIAEEQRKDAATLIPKIYNRSQRLNNNELFKLTAFFRKSHTPLDRAKIRQTMPKDKKIIKKPSYYSCENCGSKQVFMEHNNGYQLYCLDCSHILEIDKSCSSCHKDAYVRREENKYYLECENCLHSELIFVDGNIVAATG